jgi:asparagine synthase (glutamine-hydrolysing)
LTWWSIMETLPRPSQRIIARREFRYPFLDRDLVDFLLRVPANQLMRPGRRRLLMRRALCGIVPVQVLERKRKAYVARGPLVAVSQNKARLISLMNGSKVKSLGYVDEDRLLSEITKVDSLPNYDWQSPLLSAIHFELWMGRLTENCAQSKFGP